MFSEIPDTITLTNHSMKPAPKPLTAMLVDDEAYFRRFVGQILQQCGIKTVAEARDGKEALDLFNQFSPDLVVLDINMPCVDGMETLRALRPLAGDRPIIMLTSIADEMIVERCVEEGATFFIRKDVSAQELAEALQEVLREWVGAVAR